MARSLPGGMVMMENTPKAQRLFPHLPERIAGLEALAENLWWGWNPGARMLFKTLEEEAVSVR
jgi:starch phosphorylase